MTSSDHRRFKRLRDVGRGRHFAFVAMVLTQLLVLARSALIARALGPEQYGVAATFILLQQFLDSTSDAGLGKYVVANAKGYSRSTLAAVHAISLARSLIISILLVGIAFPLFGFFGISNSVLPFIILALSVIFIGMTSFDGIRMQRSGNLFSVSAASLLSDLIATLAAIIIIEFERGYIAAIYVIFIKSFCSMIFSHLLAKRTYTVRFNLDNIKIVMSYSYPLLINGPILFVSAQAERLVAVFSLNAVELGLYTAAILLISVPSQVFLRFLGTIYLPVISRQVWQTGRHSAQFAWVVGVSAFVMSAGFAVLGQWLILLIFGQAYRLEWLLVFLIGLTQSLRFSRVWFSTVLLAYGMTNLILSANIVRLLGIPLCLFAVVTIGGMKGLAIGAFFGEVAALVYATWTFKRGVARLHASS